MKLKHGGAAFAGAIRYCAAAIATALPLMAAQAQQASPNVTVTRLTPEQASQVVALKKSVQAHAAQRASVDEHGALRPHEHDDHQSDATAKTVDKVARNPATSALVQQNANKTVYHANGARGQRFSPEFLNFATASVGKDGKLTQDCLETEDMAKPAVAAPQATKGAK